MARLNINTNLRSVVVVGEFCGWDIDKLSLIKVGKSTRQTSERRQTVI